MIINKLTATSINPPPPHTHTKQKLMMEQSALANDLKAVFHGLKDMESGPGSDPTRPQLLEVAVNGWIRINFPARYPSSSGASSWTGCGSRPPEIVPRAHTLLLLPFDETECVRKREGIAKARMHQHVHIYLIMQVLTNLRYPTHKHNKPNQPRLLAKLPADGSEQLRALVQACNPLKTLEELGAATRIAPAQMALLASHLVYWGYARVIRTITLRSIYAVIRGSIPVQYSPFSFSFQRTTPSFQQNQTNPNIHAAQALGAHPPRRPARHGLPAALSAPLLLPGPGGVRRGQGAASAA